MSQPTLNLDQLLKTGAAAARANNRSVARAIFLALSREYPEEVRVWMALTTVAADPAEERMAFTQVLALDPTNKHARTALQRLSEPAPLLSAAQPVLPATVVDAPITLPAPPDEVEETESERTPFPLLNQLALLVIILLIGAIGLVIGQKLLATPPTGNAPSATPVLAVNPEPAPAPTLQPILSVSITPARPTVGSLPSTIPARPTASAVASSLALSPVASREPAIIPSVPLTSTVERGANTELPLGQILDYDGWSVTLLHPEYAMELNGSIGDLQPRGRFVLAVLAVSNNSPSPRVIPIDLFTLSDSRGRRYAPAPGASTTYLLMYGRGQRGDLALEDRLEANSGMRSVPVLFDVPLDATSLRLVMKGAAGAGWPISASAPTSVGP